jgi:hypothetical protein
VFSEEIEKFKNTKQITRGFKNEDGSDSEKSKKSFSSEELEREL